MNTLFSIIIILALAAAAMYLIHKEHEPHGTRAFEIRFYSQDGKTLGAYRDAFRPSELRSESPITRESLYGKVVSWDFHTMKATWWFKGTPDEKHITDIIEVDNN